MRYVFAIFRYFPLFAVPAAAVIAELAYFMKRKGAKSHWLYWIVAAFLLIASVAWGVFRGDIHSDEWLKEYFGPVVTTGQ